MNPLPFFTQEWQRPTKARPIVIIGAGGIVNDAHLPAYQKAGFKVSGIYDSDQARSKTVAAKWNVPKKFSTLAEATAEYGVVYDVAVPPKFFADTLIALPQKSIVLLQKPMGTSLSEAKYIRQICRERQLTAALNFQLRFSPFMLALSDILKRKLLGEVTDVEFRLNIQTPWELFPYLKNLPRLEILFHSIHYLDWIRSSFGEPMGVYARTLCDPRFPDFGSTRSSIILNYGDNPRVSLSINHNHTHGSKHQSSAIKIEGTNGSAVVKLGLLLNYPTGEPDELELKINGQDWEKIPLQGRWFPDAFIGTMSSLQRFAAGEDNSLPTSVDDAYKTMSLVEACYQSDASGGTPIPS